MNDIYNKRLELSPSYSTFGGRRDMYKVLGYKKGITPLDYWLKYRRQDIAQRIIDSYPTATWGSEPLVSDNEEQIAKSVFDKQFIELSKKLRLYYYLNRLDKLSRLGRFAILFLGLADNKPFSEEVSQGKHQILYIMPYAEKDVEIRSFQKENVYSPDFGKPLIYSVTNSQDQNMLVHASRVLHLTENGLDSDIYSIPTLEPIFNRLDDLEKIIGGSSEIFWLNGRGGINLNASLDTDILEPNKLQEHAEDYANQLTRILKTRGIDVKTLELAVHSPMDNVSVILDLISGATAIPKRILTGSEMGQLASSQDRINWQTRVKERRENHCEPAILRPLIDRFIELGILPAVDYHVIWSDDNLQSEQEKSERAARLSQALATYANSDAEDIVPHEQFVEDILQLEYKSDTLDDLLGGTADEMEEEESANDQGDQIGKIDDGVTSEK